MFDILYMCTRKSETKKTWYSRIFGCIFLRYCEAYNDRIMEKKRQLIKVKRLTQEAQKFNL